MAKLRTLQSALAALFVLLAGPVPVNAPVSVAGVFGVSTPEVGGAHSFSELPPDQVDAVGYRVEVTGVKTRGVATEVVQLRAAGDRSDKYQVGFAVDCWDSTVGSCAYHDPSVSVRFGHGPFPTLIRAKVGGNRHDFRNKLLICHSHVTYCVSTGSQG